MITCEKSLGQLGRNEANIFVVSDSVLSVDQKWDFEIMRFDSTYHSYHHQ